MTTRMLSISLVALIALVLAAPAFASDGDRLPYPDPGRPYNYQLAADGDQLPVVAADGDQLPAIAADGDQLPTLQVAADGDEIPTTPWQG